MRTRPEHEQHRFSLAVAGSITAFIAVIWVMNTRATLRTALSNSTAGEARGPVALISEQFSFVAERMTQLFNTGENQ